ncbi:hypothetical protein [Citrobacter sp. Igbk 14]|uniref:hypothetical protein n=1 Tax=Citrobacter sp. Igbk 14 TaxID=2963960 RepID=UPI0023032D3C|nr:hypothetical protein [Citrobacter sp. Igbk 14]MDA8510930.1 hypothetical protein [Citrobacter sp. Igbk 14]
MKRVLMIALLAWGGLSTSASYAEDFDPEAVAAEHLKNSDSVWADTKPVKKDPASGFWTCSGIRLHMGVDLGTWQNLDTQELFMLTEKPEKKDAPGPVKNGMAYLYHSLNNPAYVRGFAVDKAGKQLYIQDELKFSKYYRCKRDN